MVYERGETSEVRVELRRAPLVPAAGALIAGILGGRFGPLTTSLWAVVGVASAGVAVAGLWRRLTGVAAVGVLVAVAAFGAVAVRLDYFAAADDDILTYTGPDDILATVRGQVVSSPAVYEDDPPAAYGYRRPPQTRFVLRAEELRGRDGWMTVSGMLSVTVQQADDRLKAGQKVEVMGWLGRVRGPDNPGQYDWAAVARNKGMPVRLVAPGAESVSILEERPGSWVGRAYWGVRTAAREHLAGCGDERSSQLVNAMVIGERLPALRSLNQAMMRAGVVHYLSISGSHLAIFLGFVYLLCRVLALSPRRSAVAVLVVLGVYIILAEAQAPLVRSALMATALCLATIAGRRHGALNALAGAAVLILAVAPMDLFEAGFQLSFGIVGGTLVFRGPVRQAIFGRFLRERGLMVFRDRDRVRRWLHYTAANWLMDGVAIAVVAYLVSAPLVAYHFHLFSPYAGPLSMVLAPLVTAVLVPGYVSLALAWPMPNLAYAFGQVAASSADGLAWTVEGMERLPGLSFELRDVGVGWVLLCYVAMAAVVAARRVRFGRAMAAAAVALLAVATAYAQRTSGPSGQAELNVLAVGNGQCVVLRTPSGQTVLLDAGTRSGFDAYRQVLGPFLRSGRLASPTAAFISHANVDHFSALDELGRRRSLRRVHVNEQFGESAGRGDAFSADVQMIGTLRAGGAQVMRLAAGETVRLDDRTKVEVLWPPAGRAGLGANESSLVLRVTCDGMSVLLPGDVETVGQVDLARAGLVVADVLVLPHHGSWRPSLEEFIKAVAPRVVLASSGREPYGPGATEEPAEFFGRLRRGRQYYSTPRNGWIQVRFGGGTIEVRTMR